MSDTKLPATRDKADQLESLASLRLRMLEESGFGPAEQVALLKRVIESAASDLEAEKITVVSWGGEITATHAQPDYGARAKARDQIIDLIGARAKDAQAPAQPAQRQPLPPAPWMLQVNVDHHTPQAVVVEGVTDHNAPPTTPSPIVEVTPLPIGTTDETPKGTDANTTRK